MYWDKNLDPDSLICLEEVKKLDLVKIDLLKASQNDSPIRHHSDKCGRCDKTIKLTVPGSPDNQQMQCDGDRSIPVRTEYVRHRHIASPDGYVAPIKQSFVKFVLRTKNLSTQRRLTLSVCICSGCYNKLQRKYEYAKKGSFYSPKSRKFPRKKCSVPGCLKPADDKDEIPCDLAENFAKSLNINFDKNKKFGLCRDHRRDAVRKDDRCFVCQTHLRKVSKTQRCTPGKDEKNEFMNVVGKENASFTIPPGFVDIDYMGHKKCWWNQRYQLRKHRQTANQSQNESQIYEELDDFCQSEEEAGCAEDSMVSCSSTEDDIEMSSEDSDQNDTASPLTKRELLQKADRLSIQYIRDKIKKETFLDRVEVEAVFNDYLKTLAFQNGESYFKVPTLRGEAVQQRILNAWEPADDSDELQFTFCARNSGN